MSKKLSACNNIKKNCKKIQPFILLFLFFKIIYAHCMTYVHIFSRDNRVRSQQQYAPSKGFCLSCISTIIFRILPKNMRKNTHTGNHLYVTWRDLTFSGNNNNNKIPNKRALLFFTIIRVRNCNYSPKLNRWNIIDVNGMDFRGCYNMTLLLFFNNWLCHSNV